MRRILKENRKAVFIVICVFTICAIFLSYMDSLFRPLFYEKTRFNDNDLRIIADNIHIDCTDAKVEKVTFSHAKDSVFHIYLSDVKYENIDLNYYDIIERSETENNILCYKRSENIDVVCILDTETNTAEIELDKYDDGLFKMIKK